MPYLQYRCRCEECCKKMFTQEFLNKRKYTSAKSIAYFLSILHISEFITLYLPLVCSCQ